MAVKKEVKKDTYYDDMLKEVEELRIELNPKVHDSGYLKTLDLIGMIESRRLNESILELIELLKKK